MTFNFSSISLSRCFAFGIWIGSFGLYAPEARADRTDRIRVMLHQGRGERAMSNCQDWDAHEMDAPERLREVCAQAAWQQMELSDSYEGWLAFQETWAGTQWAEMAIDREASSRLGSLDASMTEAELQLLAERYADTESQEAYDAIVAEAAYREVDSVEDALRVARTWPIYLWDLVRRYPVDFVKVVVDGRQVSVALVDEFAERVEEQNGNLDLAAHQIEVRWRWMAENGDGQLADWDSTVVAILREWGVRHEVISALPMDTGEARLPICLMADPPDGWHPVLQIMVDDVEFIHSIEADSDCSESTWPVFVSRQNGRAIGISLRPGHRLDLRSDAQVSDIRELVHGSAVGDVVLGPDGIYQQYAAIQVVQPLSGGTPWTTLRSAGQWSQPLGSSLYLDPVPNGWEIVPQGEEMQARSEVLARMPPALRRWNLIAGDVSVIPLQMRAVIGLTTDRASPPMTPAPRMTAQSGWVRTANGGVDASPPEGASVAGLYAMTGADLLIAEGILSAMSLTDDCFELWDGWRVDLDQDRVEESVLRARNCGGTRGDTIVFVLDPVVGERSLSADNVRVFGWTSAAMSIMDVEVSTPFPFRKGDHTYLAWSTWSQDDAGVVPEGVVNMEVLRSDGTGFISDDFVLSPMD